MLYWATNSAEGSSIPPFSAWVQWDVDLCSLWCSPVLAAENAEGLKFPLSAQGAQHFRSFLETQRFINTGLPGTWSSFACRGENDLKDKKCKRDEVVIQGHFIPKPVGSRVLPTSDWEASEEPGACRVCDSNHHITLFITCMTLVAKRLIHRTGQLWKEQKWGKRPSSLHLTEQPTNQFATFGKNQIFLASVSTLGVKQDISGSVACSPDGRACNVEVDLYELSKKNHPSGRFSIWDSEQI